jgi:hypothetical protein
MACKLGPDIVSNGLVASFDALNPRGFPSTTPIVDHGYAEWYCFENCNVTYSIISSGISIVEKDSSGGTSTIVSTSSGPTRGTFSAIQGRTYYGVGGSINLVAEDQHHMIVPLTMMGTQFYWNVVRLNPGTVYIYSPFKNATVKFFDNPASGGITNTSPTSIITVNARTQTSFTFNTLGNYYISSSEPIICSTTQSASLDRTILSPASKYVYQRFLASFATVIGTTPLSNQGGCIHDPTNSVMSTTIADGAGGDCAQGLGLEYLSDRYSWGNALSDYVVVFPYTATVTTSYWNGTSWVVWDTHSNITGNLTTPTVISRDGTNGPGVTAGNVSGTAANMAGGANLWRWEGTAPFYLCINDTADDEFSVLGWSNIPSSIRNKNQYWVDGVSGNQMTVHGSLIHNSNGYWTFPNNQITNYIMQTGFQIPQDDITMSCWFRSNFSNPNQTPFTYSVNGDNMYLLFTNSATSISPFSFNSPLSITVPNMQNRWCNFVRTREKSTGQEFYYLNGTQIGSRIISANISPPTNGALIIGQEVDSNPLGSGGGNFDSAQNLDGDFAKLDIYNRVLSNTEVLQNFNIERLRFGV